MRKRMILVAMLALFALVLIVPSNAVAQGATFIGGRGGPPISITVKPGEGANILFGDSDPPLHITVKTPFGAQPPDHAPPG